MKRKINYPLYFGLTIIIIIAYVALFPKTLTKINPYSIDSVKSIISMGGVSRVQGAPFKPSKEYLLGSDTIGRDIFSMIIYGTKLTIGLGLLIAICRFLIAIPVGLAAGFGNKLSNVIIDHMKSIFSALPVLITAVIILKLNFFTSLYKKESIIAFLVVLTILDFPKLASIIRERTNGILNSSYVKCERAIGKSDFKISTENIIPHLLPEIIVLFFMEVSRALTLLMQLGIFGVFIGNLKYVGSGDGEVLQFLNLTFEPEWASMLSTTIYNIYSAPWTVIWPSLAFFISILGFNFFGEGLRIEFQRKDSRFVTYVRRALTFDVTKKESFKKSWRTLATIAACLIAFVIVINLYSNKRYDISKTKEPKLQALSQESVISTDESIKNGEVLAQVLSSIGANPLYKGNYFMDYKINKYTYVQQADINFTYLDKTLKLKFGKDFIIINGASGIYQGEIFNGQGLDFINFTDYKSLEGKYVLLNGDEYASDTLEKIIDSVVVNSNCLGIGIIKKNIEDNGGIYSQTYNRPVLYISYDALKGIKSLSKVSLDYKSKPLGENGRNIAGIIYSKEKDNSREAIIIGVPYNYRKEDSILAKKRIELAIKLCENIKRIGTDRNIILLFYDGSLCDATDGKYDYVKKIPYTINKSKLYIELGEINSDSFDKVFLSKDQTPISRYFAFNFEDHLKNYLNSSDIKTGIFPERDIDTVLETGPKANEEMYYGSSIPTINLSTDKGKKNNLDDLGSLILKTIDKIYY